MEINILGIFPLTGNGGIASWTKKFLSSFPDKTFKIDVLDVSPHRPAKTNYLQRLYTGLIALLRIKKELSKKLKSCNYDIMHITTSGNLGSIRDLILARKCQRYGIKTIMHCRYGCISEDFHSKGLIGHFLRLALKQYDQIWVLDKRSYNTLCDSDFLSNKVYLTPNSIDVFSEIDLKTKTYNHAAFIANLIPSKGLFESIEAAKKTHIRLDIIGPGSDDIIDKVKLCAGEAFNHYIFLLGPKTNQEVMEYMKEIDMLLLPTYYPSEAFPISILEAMSLSKLVISTNRAAISDMLCGENGERCGIIVREKSIKDIVTAIEYCKNNPLQADAICQNAYHKVFSSYRKEIVYEIYRNNYTNLLNQ